MSMRVANRLIKYANSKWRMSAILYLIKNVDTMFDIFYHARINAKLAKILEFVLIGGSDIGESLIYLIKYANYAN